MRADSARWHEITPSEFDHEREGLAHVRDLLPDRAPYQAWTNFEFRDKDGKWYEVDALVLGERRLHLVELKHYRGMITGNAYRWQRGGRTEESPLVPVRRKAQRLKGVITDALRDLQPDLDPRHVPYIQHSVFLHAADGRCALPPSDATDLFGLDGNERRSGLPSIAVRLLESPGAGERPGLLGDDELLVKLFERIGFALRREREVGSWRLVGAPLAEGDGWQDWPAEHRVARQDQARIRFFVSKPGATDAERRAVTQLAQREYDLTGRLQHDGLLRPRDLVEDDLGVGLVYPRDDRFRPLDLWLADHGHELPLLSRVGVIRQAAEALAYAHRHHVVHRGLSPAAVLVRQHDDVVEVRLGDWQVAGADQATGRTSSSATRLFAVLEGRGAGEPEQQRAGAYLAPEGRWVAGADRLRLDVFALGAVVYHLIAGRPPATDATDLRDRLSRDGGLDLVADVPEVPASLRTLVLRATRPLVSDRLPDLQEFLALLDNVDREIASEVAGTAEDPLAVPPDTLIGRRFELVGRLGSGSTAVGLLVKDRTAGDELRVLKVALNDSAATRLQAEAEVLTSLRRLDHPRLIRLAEPEPLRVGSRTALLLEYAGETTLAQELRKRPRLSLDLLERWGVDLLSALVALDKANVDHRDIKPANLGVREQRGDRTKHLVLFDFSLSQAGASAVKAGTPPYLDPFLGTALRPHWDSAAERYAAAVTLFEMATGQTPRYGDGLSFPGAIGDQAAIEPGLFDPSMAAGLVHFFTQALRRDARQRLHTAGEMLAAWRAVFVDAPTTIPGDADDRIAAAQPETPLVASGLSARALSALEPLQVTTVGELASVDPVRLSRLAGVSESTRREVRKRAKQWRDRLGPQPETRREPSALVHDSDNPLADPVATAEILVRAAGGAPASARHKVARRMLGVAADGGALPSRDATVASAFGTLAELAPILGLGGQPQVSRTLADLQEAWAADEQARSCLDEVLVRATAALMSLSGLATVDALVEALAADVGGDVSAPLGGLLRMALDRADTVERGGGDTGPIARRRRRNRGGMLLATAAPLLDVAESLGRTADDLVAVARTGGDDLVPMARASAGLRPLWPQRLPAPDDQRLVRLAARLSARSGVSRPGELHDRDMDPAAALANALGALEPSQRLTPADLAERVRARFPDLAPLPPRPALDQVVSAAKLPLQWNGEVYAVPTRRRETTLASRPPATYIPVFATGPVPATREDERLVESARSRSFLALGVTPHRLDRMAGALVERHGAHLVDLTAVLMTALRGEASQKGVPWSEVRAADAAEPGSRPFLGLTTLVRGAIPAIEAAIADAAAGAEEATRPVLLVEAAPLARYGHLEVLARVADITTRRAQAIWLLVPQESDSGATLDGTPVPLAHGGQFLLLDEDWLRGSVLDGEPA